MAVVMWFNLAIVIYRTKKKKDCYFKILEFFYLGILMFSIFN